MDNSEPDFDNKYAPHLVLLAVQAFFGSLPVVGKIVLAVMPSVALVGFRVGITALVLVLFQRFRGTLRLAHNGDYWRLAVLSLFAVTFNQLLFIGGLSLTKATNTSLLIITIPIFTLTISAVLGFEKLRIIKIVGIILAAAGVIFLIDPRNASFSSETTLGDIFIILNSLSYGIYVATSQEVIRRNGALRSTTWIFIFAAIVCVPLGAISISTIDIEAISITIWLLAMHVAIIATAVPYLLNAWALVRVNPSTVAVYVYLQPIIGFALAIIFLGEKLEPTLILAAVLIFAGVYLVIKKKSEPGAVATG